MRDTEQRIRDPRGVVPTVAAGSLGRAGTDGESLTARPHSLGGCGLRRSVQESHESHVGRDRSSATTDPAPTLMGFLESAKLELRVVGWSPCVPPWPGSSDHDPGRFPRGAGRRRGPRESRRAGSVPARGFCDGGDSVGTTRKRSRSSPEPFTGLKGRARVRVSVARRGETAWALVPPSQRERVPATGDLRRYPRFSRAPDG